MLYSLLGYNSLKSLIPPMRFTPTDFGTTRRSGTVSRDLGRTRTQARTQSQGSAPLEQINLEGVGADFVKKVQSVIDKYGRGKSPINAQQLIQASQKSGVPIDFMLVSGIQESNLGTAGRAVATRNIFNVGNTDGGDGKAAKRDKYNEFHDDWMSGINRFTSLITKQYFPGKKPTLDAFIANDFRRPDGARYMTNPKAKQAYISLANSVRKMLK